jgi:two-component system chemotaxis response regulator CheB
VHASDGEPIVRGRIYIAPPDQHMSFTDGHVALSRGPKVNGHRPSIDSLFESGAATFGGRVTAVVLSGVLDDGAAGLLAVANAGGATLVQSAGDALYPTMPAAAIEAVDQPDFIGTAPELAARIVELTKEVPVDPPPRKMARLPGIGEDDYIAVDRGSSDHPQPGDPSGFTCPECHGALWSSQDANGVRFRCRTGHVFSSDALLAGQDDHVERALWAALRALEEKAAMLRRIALRARGRGHVASAARFEQKANAALEEAVAVREVIARFEPVGDALADEEEAV